MGRCGAVRCRRILRIRGQYFFTQYFHFCRSARKESDPADFFQTLALLHRTIFYLFLLYVNFTVQSSTLYVVDLSPPIRQGLGSLALLQKKKTRLPSSTSEMLDKMTLIPNPNAENTARSQLYGEKKNCLPVRSRFVPTPTRNNHTANTTCWARGLRGVSPQCHIIHASGTLHFLPR